MTEETTKDTAKSSILGMSRRQITLWSSFIAVIVIVGISYYFYTKYHPSTDDAYVKANVVEMAPQVSGPIANIYVRNNQVVKKGQALLDIDPRPYAAAVKKARAQLQLARQSMEVDTSAIQVAEAQLNKAQADLVVKERNYRRISTLVKHKQASIASGDKATGEYKTAKAAVVAATNQLRQAKQKLGDIGNHNAQIKQAKANLMNAQLNLDYTHLRAPADGYIANFKVRMGSMATAHQILFELVEKHLWWVDANFKETQMTYIKPNQVVSIEVDMYPGHKFKGYVQSLSPGSGTVFSLLPPENATGNWVKVTQRFPVKVVILNPNDAYPLRMGASAEVTVNTRQYIKPPKLPELPGLNLATDFDVAQPVLDS